VSSHKVCPQWASIFIVPQTYGDSDYMVKFIVGSQPVCTCPAYRYSGEYDKQTCKHIRAVREHGCFYFEPPNGSFDTGNLCGKRDLEDVGINIHSTTAKNNLAEDLCLGCGKPMIEVFV
jgi:hypothetical protein